MTLKRGSLKSFFRAPRFCTSSTPGRMNLVKSDSMVSVSTGGSSAWPPLVRSAAVSPLSIGDASSAAAGATLATGVASALGVASVELAPPGCARSGPVSAGAACAGFGSRAAACLRLRSLTRAAPIRPLGSERVVALHFAARLGLVVGRDERLHPFGDFRTHRNVVDLLATIHEPGRFVVADSHDHRMRGWGRAILRHPPHDEYPRVRCGHVQPVTLGFAPVQLDLEAAKAPLLAARVAAFQGRAGTWRLRRPDRNRGRLPALARPTASERHALHH